MEIYIYSEILGDREIERGIEKGGDRKMKV